MLTQCRLDVMIEIVASPALSPPTHHDPDGADGAIGYLPLEIATLRTLRYAYLRTDTADDQHDDLKQLVEGTSGTLSVAPRENSRPDPTQPGVWIEKGGPFFLYDVSRIGGAPLQIDASTKDGRSATMVIVLLLERL
jgi:hypothetical protein